MSFGIDEVSNAHQHAICPSGTCKNIMLCPVMTQTHGVSWTGKHNLRASRTRPSSRFRRVMKDRCRRVSNRVPKQRLESIQFRTSTHLRSTPYLPTVAYRTAPVPQLPFMTAEILTILNVADYRTPRMFRHGAIFGPFFTVEPIQPNREKSNACSNAQLSLVTSTSSMFVKRGERQTLDVLLTMANVA